MSNPFKKREKSLQAVTSYYCPQCKKERVIPGNIVYDFTKEEYSHPGGETLFVCTHFGTPYEA